MGPEHSQKMTEMADRVMAQRMLPNLLKTAKGREAVVESCVKWILNRAGELNPNRMPTLEDAAAVTDLVSGIVSRMCTGIADMNALSDNCEKAAKALVNVQGDQ